LFPESIPNELKEGKVWVCCDESKVPLIPLKRGYQRASSTKATTWRSYEQAIRAYMSNPKVWGLGRVIEADSPYVGVDLDDCRDPETGKLKPRGVEILDALDSYSEVSPSGTGVKVWVRSELAKPQKKEGVEIYPRGRYFTVTGQRLARYKSEITSSPRSSGKSSPNPHTNPAGTERGGISHRTP